MDPSVVQMNCVDIQDAERLIPCKAKIPTHDRPPARRVSVLEDTSFRRLLQLAILRKLHLVPKSDQNLFNPHIAIPLLGQAVDLAEVDLACLGIDASHVDLRDELDLWWRGGIRVRTMDHKLIEPTIVLSLHGMEASKHWFESWPIFVQWDGEMGLGIMILWIKM